MIDVETIGEDSTAMMISFAAVSFDVKFPSKKDVFYRNINLDSYKSYGNQFTLDHSCIEFWMKQNEDVRLEAFANPVKSDIKSAISEFAKWINEKSKGLKIVMWAHGISFDISVIKHHFHVLNIPVPWKCWDIFDTRTLFQMVGFNFNHIGSVPINDVMYSAHHPVGDCARQIEGIRMCYTQNNISRK